MDLECVKYKEKMPSEDAICRHPDDYCKFRSSCIIHFMSGERKKENGKSVANAAEIKGDKQQG